MKQAPDRSGDPAVTISGLKHRYGSYQALRGISCSVDAGVTGLIGVNGAGKSTFLRVLSTTLRPTQGDVRVLGEDLRTAAGRRAVRAQLGYVPQDLSLPGNLAVDEVLTYMAWLHRVHPAARSRAVSRVIDLCHLGAVRRHRIRALSGGTARRVVLAQALVHRPALLVLDEPTTGLDPEQRISYREVLRQLPSDTVTVLSTHLIEDVAHAAADVMVLEQGQLVYRGTTDGLAQLGEDGSVPGDSPLERGFIKSRTAADLALT